MNKKNGLIAAVLCFVVSSWLELAAQDAELPMGHSQEFPLLVDVNQEFSKAMAPGESLWINLWVPGSGIVRFSNAEHDAAHCTVQFFDPTGPVDTAESGYKAQEACELLARIHRTASDASTDSVQVTGSFAFSSYSDVYEPNDLSDEATAKTIGQWSFISLPVGDSDFISANVPGHGRLKLQSTQQDIAMQLAADWTDGEQSKSANGLMNGHGFPVEPGPHLFRLYAKTEQGLTSTPIRFEFEREEGELVAAAGQLPRVRAGGIYAFHPDSRQVPHGFEIDIERPSRVVVSWIGDQEYDVDYLNAIVGYDLKITCGEAQIPVEVSPWGNYFHAYPLNEPGRYRFEFTWRPIAEEVRLLVETVELQPGDTPEMAIDLSLNTPHSASLKYLGYEKWFRIQLPEPGILQGIAFHRPALGTLAPCEFIDVYEADACTLVKTLTMVKGAQYSFDSSIAADRTLRIDKSGDYYLRSHGYNTNEPFFVEANFVPESGGPSPVISGGLAVAHVGLQLSENGKNELLASSASNGSICYLTEGAEQLHATMKSAVLDAHNAMIPERIVQTSRDAENSTEINRSVENRGWVWAPRVVVLTLLVGVAYLIIRPSKGN